MRLYVITSNNIIPKIFPAIYKYEEIDEDTLQKIIDDTPYEKIFTSYPFFNKRFPIIFETNESPKKINIIANDTVETIPNDTIVITNLAINRKVYGNTITDKLLGYTEYYFKNIYVVNHLKQSLTIEEDD